MKKRRNWAIALILSATAGVFALQNVSVPDTVDLPSEDGPMTSTATGIVTFTPTYEGCAYMWAYHKDPALSAKLNEAVLALHRSAGANAQLFGEDCVYADGHSTFGAMETDFYIQLPVDVSTTEEAMGNSIKQVMDVIAALPEDEVQGRKGFAEFSFPGKGADPIIIRIEIGDYLQIPNPPGGIELFQRFYTPTPPPALSIPITPTSTP